MYNEEKGIDQESVEQRELNKNCVLTCKQHQEKSWQCCAQEASGERLRRVIEAQEKNNRW